MVDPAKRFSIEGKSVIVTGASGAMGSEAAKALGAAGANVTLAGTNVAVLEELCALQELAGHSTIVARRPDELADAEAIVAGAVAAFGGIDGMLVASGMNKVGLITDQSVAKAAAPVLIDQGRGGSVVLVSSTRGKLGHPAGYTAYCPSKAAVDLLGKTLAAEWGPHQIRCNVLAPTVFRSELTAWMYADDEKGRATREAMFSRIPLKRFAEPEDFVGALVYLLSDSSSFMTGQVLYLDGGYTAC